MERCQANFSRRNIVFRPLAFFVHWRTVLESQFYVRRRGVIHADVNVQYQRNVLARTRVELCAWSPGLHRDEFRD